MPEIQQPRNTNKWCCGSIVPTLPGTLFLPHARAERQCRKTHEGLGRITKHSGNIAGVFGLLRLDLPQLEAAAI